MKVTGLDDREYNWPQTKDCKDKDLPNQSLLHQEALSLLKDLFPTQIILEEVKIPGSRLRIDIYLPLQKLAIEIQGSQHYKFNTFFHRNKLSYFQACGRDRTKKKWCSDHEIVLIDLPYNMRTIWGTLILGIINGE